jgi:hypothetical protein
MSQQTLGASPSLSGQQMSQQQSSGLYALSTSASALSGNHPHPQASATLTTAASSHAHPMYHSHLQHVQLPQHQQQGSRQQPNLLPSLHGTQSGQYQYQQIQK